MKLYTRTGDDGTTSLHGGQRVDKDALRVEAFGSVDELNAHLGLALVICNDPMLRHALSPVQARLFEIGADLATPGGDGQEPAHVIRFDGKHIAELETQIDQICQDLPAMKHFILPGGNELSARLHVARTVCRRAERRCVSLGRQTGVNDQLVIYLNRLSDLLFAAARRANHLANVADVPWVPHQS